MPPTPSPADIRAFVQAASRIWVRRLIDYSRSNSLLFYRDLKVGTFDLTAYKGVLEKLLAGDALTVEQIVGARARQQQRDPVARERAEEELRQKIRTVFVALRRKALGNHEEKGIQTLHLAVGMASWPAADGGRPYAAPILLIPASIDARGRSGNDLRLAAAGEPRLNPVLLSVLAEVHDVRVDASAVMKECGDEDEAGQWRIEPDKVFAALRAMASSVGQFAVESRCIVANFQFAKMAMVEDLKKNEEAMASSPFIAAIAGHSASRQQLSQAGVEVEPRQLDEMPSNKDFLVLDADSTQQRAIVAVGKGLNCVVQGPPGTGKSQTIANLIAQNVAEGKRVLFVAEKRAALDAVVKRLTHPDVDLGHLILDLHGASVSRKDVMANLSRTLDSIRQSLPVEGAENVYREFDARRRKLNEHARVVNADRAPTGLSMNRVIGRLLRLPKEAASELRFRGDAFARLTHERAEDIKRLLRECAAHRALLLGEDTSPWGTAKVADGRTAQLAVDLAVKLARDLLPRADKLLTEWTRSTQVAKPSGIEAALRLGKCIVDTDSFRQKFRPELFGSDPVRLAASLSPATKGAASALWAWLTDGKYREALRKMRSLATTEASARELKAGAQRAAELAALWRKVCPAGGVPDTNTAKKLLLALQNVTVALKEFRALTGLDVAKGLTFADSQSRLESLAADQRTPYQIASVHELRQQIREHGLEPLLQELRSQKVPESLWQQRFEYVWLYSALDNILASEQSLAVFSGRTHECLIEEFRRLDRERIGLAAARVRRLHAERAVAAMNEHFEQGNLVRSESRKQSRHIPLRDLLSRAPDVLTRIAPCWIASPLSVSQLLDGSKRHFDIVIFDEASQILQEEAMPALWRAEQVVVAGDRHQLPPTSFFATAVDGEDMTEEEKESAEAAMTATSAVGGYESLLATLEAFLPNILLEWHYRSEDERLISFSNEHIYGGRLVTFPTARSHDAVRHVLVPHDRALGAQDESASREVEEVVRLVIEHAETRPDESLGVIAMGVKHANRVQAALDRALEGRADLADFFSLDRDERFFVKNLETVQGDEREAIILTIGYGKAANGDLPHRFGPLTHEAGHRRLNVAVTRAKRRMTVVSSFAHHEVDLARSGSRGVQLLKAYLEYAASGGSRLTQAEVAGEVPLNPFEADIRDALEAAGIYTRPQFGASRYRIDLVAMHPEKRGRPVLAIECDGATYHSSATARDRDRLRQMHLQRLGWRFHRIWSTDWFFNREAEMARLVAAFGEAVSRADEADAGQQEEMCQEERSDAMVPQQATAVVQPSRGPRPSIRRRDSIDGYTNTELRQLADWIASDGLLRTDDEFVRCMLEELPFNRLGARIRERLEEVVRQRGRVRQPR
jgi:very-short-patch-repair endonuclease